MGLAGGAGNLQGMEFLDVVAHDMQLVRSAVRRVQRAQSVPMPIRDGRVHVAVMHARIEGRQGGGLEILLEFVFVDHRDFHGLPFVG